jgi:hypothetical protein
MVARMQGKKKPYALLVGMKISSAAMSISMNLPQHTKNEIIL